MNIVIKKIYRNAKTDKKGKNYELVNILAGDKKYTIFDYEGETGGWEDGQSIDISGYTQKESVYNGKTSYVLSKPRKSDLLKKRVEELEKAMRVVVAELRSRKKVNQVVEVLGGEVIDEPLPEDLPF